MPKRILRNALLMALATFLMALGLVAYIRSTGPLPVGDNPDSRLLHDGVYTSAQQGYLSEVTVTVVKDGPKKLAARRKIMSKLYDLQEIKAFTESKSAYKARTKDVAHPLIEKLFNEIAPKYAQRNDEKNCAGGYTRIISLGERRGDAAEVAIIELV